MKFSTASLFVFCQLVSRGLAEAGTDLKGKTYEPITLEFGKEYAESDLSKLFEQQGKGTQDHSIDGEPVLPADSGTKSSPALLQSRSVVKGRQWESTAAITYSATCQWGFITRGNFQVKVNFDGRRAHFTKLQNIDNFGYISIHGGGHKPLISAADYWHYICKAPNSKTICTWLHFGIITAEITSQSLTIGATPWDPFNRYNKPWIVQTCAPIPKGGKATCPEVDKSTEMNFCEMSKISVVPV